jgi:glycosyltransferase involved in cell wall biosynthesis
MKAAFDVSPLSQTGAGTARVVRGLVGALEGRAGLEILPVDFAGKGRAATVVRDLAWYPFVIAGAARSADVLHCTTMRGPLRTQCPVVITVHDCALLRHPETFPPWHRHTGRVALRHGAKSADAIVAVSAFTRDELVELLGVPEARIRIVPNGLQSVFSEAGPKASGDYVLAVGTLEPRKNLGNAVVAAKRAGVELRVVGAPGWGGVEVPGWAGRVDDAELAALYRGARCLVFPSLYEGFGLPVIEAMACGTPVVTSRGGATEEVAGGAAVLVDALDPDAIAAGIAEAEARRDELRRLGLERAGAFTWSHAADLVEALWRELA